MARDLVEKLKNRRKEKKRVTSLDLVIKHTHSGDDDIQNTHPALYFQVSVLECTERGCNSFSGSIDIFRAFCPLTRQLSSLGGALFIFLLR